MVSKTTNIITTFIGILIFYYGIIPIIYAFLNPIGFWQNLVMLFTADVVALALTIRTINGFLSDTVDFLFP